MASATRISLEDWLKQPDTEPSREFVCGEVIQKLMPNLPHFVVAGYLLHLLGSHVRQHKFGVVGPELLCVFGPMTDRRGYIPDIAFVSRERLPRGDARSVVPFPLPPDLAIEILSPVQHVGQFIGRSDSTFVTAFVSFGSSIQSWKRQRYTGRTSIP